jgi:Domain of unknown function (DUF4124)
MKRLLLFAALIAWSGMASAVVYKWVDAQGKVQYGDNPPNGVHAEIVELLGTHVARQPSDAAKAAPAAPAPASAKPPAPDSAAKKQVADDVAQSREKQCTDAQDRYKHLVEGRRLYKTGADGERQYLTSEEIDKERLDAKADVDAICNSAT